MPEALEEDYHREIQAIEEAEHMQYVTTAERIGIRKGHQEGLQQGLEQGREEGLESERALVLRLVRRRFGPAVAERSAPLLARVLVPETLEQLGEAVLDCPDGETWLAELRTRAETP